MSDDEGDKPYAYTENDHTNEMFSHYCYNKENAIVMFYEHLDDEEKNVVKMIEGKCKEKLFSTVPDTDSDRRRCSFCINIWIYEDFDKTKYVLSRHITLNYYKRLHVKAKVNKLIDGSIEVELLGSMYDAY